MFVSLAVSLVGGHKCGKGSINESDLFIFFFSPLIALRGGPQKITICEIGIFASCSVSAAVFLS